MATFRPVVSVYKFDDIKEKTGTVKMPHVFVTPLRPDIVQSVHDKMARNKMQPVGVTPKAGYGTAAESWGTGRAVARIPRAPGSGTHRAGQGAFGNMCRGGGMFAPLKTWRRWAKKIHHTERRHAVCAALAASALPPLVMAHGHRIDKVPELPLVVSDGIQHITRTKEAVTILKNLGAVDDLKRVIKSKKIRAGKGKARNRRFTMRRGPIVIFKEDHGIRRAMRNIPGVSCRSCTALNLMHLAPGGQFGRFLIWTESAFKHMSEMYGTYTKSAPLKKHYRLPRAIMENADLSRIINSTEIQSVLRPKLEAPKAHEKKGNPLKSRKLMDKLNPYAKERREFMAKQELKGSAEHEAMQAAKKARKENKKAMTDKNYYKNVMAAFDTKPAVEVAEEEE